MIYPKIPLAQNIIEIFKAKGLTEIVISPGSRNAPLIIGFVNNPFFNCYSIADERCAAFFALGLAQQLRKPVAVVCTSGSALLNYYPAFAEAFYSQIPLIVLSADRPKDKIDIGDGQTIRQENVFANHSLYNANLSEFISSNNDLKIIEAITCAVDQKGPVHINSPFEEPLYETVETLSTYIDTTNLDVKREVDSVENLIDFASIWNVSPRIMILVGVNEPHSITQEVLEKMASDPSVVVLTEVTSNLHHPSFFTSIDTLITPFTNEDFENFRPEILITFGGMVVSKRIKAFLRKYQPKHHWHIDTLRAYDTYGALTKHFETNTQLFFDTFLPLTLSNESDYYQKWNNLNVFRQMKHKAYLSKIPFSDFQVFELILESLPSNIQLQISNSSAIRYAQLFNLDTSIEVFCNRGTSGIDGSTSTAIGAAFASGKPTLFITGDIGFLYDSNALWNKYIPNNFKIILINNGGGGIFRILPGHQETQVFNEFFETSHSLSVLHLAKIHGLEYYAANDKNSLLKGLTDLYSQNKKPSILEIFTPTEVNDIVLLNYFKDLI
jgi:2-succinyl-5-enolpyruvyl-6-hydroxy-3-cyclohexene-1-carboxylate synthase